MGLDEAGSPCSQRKAKTTCGTLPRAKRIIYASTFAASPLAPTPPDFAKYGYVWKFQDGSTSSRRTPTARTCSGSPRPRYEPSAHLERRPVDRLHVMRTAI